VQIEKISKEGRMNRENRYYTILFFWYFILFGMILGFNASPEGFGIKELGLFLISFIPALLITWSVKDQ